MIGKNTDLEVTTLPDILNKVNETATNKNDMLLDTIK